MKIDICAMNKNIKINKNSIWLKVWIILGLILLLTKGIVVCLIYFASVFLFVDSDILEVINSNGEKQ